MKGSHREDVKRMVREYRRNNKEGAMVRVGGEMLTVKQLAAVAKRGVRVELKEVAREGVKVMESIKKGTDCYGVTTAFGATSHRRTTYGVALQTELIR